MNVCGMDDSRHASDEPTRLAGLERRRKNDTVDLVGADKDFWDDKKGAVVEEALDGSHSRLTAAVEAWPTKAVQAAMEMETGLGGAAPGSGTCRPITFAACPLEATLTLPSGRFDLVCAQPSTIASALRAR